MMNEYGCQLLALLVPILLARIGRVPVAEDAEEIRLSLSQLLNTLLIRKSCAKIVKQSFTDISDILRSLANDTFHSVKVEASTTVLHLATAAPEKIHMTLNILATALINNFNHQRGPVRLSALSALHVILPLGGESLPNVFLNTVLPALRALRFDRTPSVRKQLASTVGYLQYALPNDVLSSHEPALLTLLAGLMADEANDVAEQAFLVFEQAAQIRRQQLSDRESNPSSAPHPNELTPDLVVAAEAASNDTTIPGYDAAVTGAQNMATALGNMAKVPIIQTNPNVTKERTLTISLPRPFVHRPRTDSIWLTQRLLPSIIPPLLEELKDWTVRTRLWAAGALRSIIMLAENGMTNHLDVIIAMLCTGSRDDDMDVRKALGEVSRLLGAFVPPQAQLNVLLPQLRGEVSGLNNGPHYASALAVLSAALSSMNRSDLAPYINDLAHTLALPSLAEDEPIALRSQLATAVGFTIRIGLGGDIFPTGSQGASTTTSTMITSSSNKDGTEESSSSEIPVLAENSPINPSTVNSLWSSSATPSFTASRSSVLADAAFDNILMAIVHICDIQAPVEVTGMGLDSAKELARTLRYTNIAEMFAARMFSLLPSIIQTASAWTRASPPRRCFDTLLRIVRPALCGRNLIEARTLVEKTIHCFINTLSPSREPELRVSMLALLDTFIAPEGDTMHERSKHTAEELSLQGRANTVTQATNNLLTGTSSGAVPQLSPHTATIQRTLHTVFPTDQPSLGVFNVSDALIDELIADNAGQLLQQGLLPNTIWRVGLVASTIRKVAIACILSLGKRNLLPLATLEPIFMEMLPVLKSCLGDDDATTRHLTCLTFSSMLNVLHHSLSDEAVRLLYPELLKRLDDSNDAIRLSACAAIRDLAEAARKEDFEGTPVEYTLDTLLIHLDDADGKIQLAVYDAILPYIRIAPVYANKATKAARDKHRHPGYCDKLLVYITTVTGEPVTPKVPNNNTVNGSNVSSTVFQPTTTTTELDNGSLL